MTGKHIPSSSSIDKAELEEMRAQDLEAKIEALENGQLRSFERKRLRQHLAMRQKVESLNCIFDRLFCSLECAKLWNQKHSPVQFRYHVDMLIDMIL